MGPNDTVGNLRHGIIAAFGERIAAQDVPCRQPRTLDSPVALDGGLRVLAASGRIAAARAALIGADGAAVELNPPEQGAFHGASGLFGCVGRAPCFFSR